MQLDTISPNKALNKAYLKEKVSRNTIDQFKENLLLLLSKIKDGESEEHHKNLVSDFLKNTWYKDSYEINTKGRNDLVIHLGKTSNEPVGVIFELKQPFSKSEMFSFERPNSKGLHELILYYFRERLEHRNTDIKYLIITNVFDWYIFDEVWFEKHLFRNSKLRKDYESWRHSGNDTKYFYESIVKPFLNDIDEPLVCTHFNLKEAEITKSDNKLITLYKILSPVHLLKQPFANDSNSLDTRFYEELLHIIGLEEVKRGNKKFIERKAEPEAAALLENTMLKLANKEKLGYLKEISVADKNIDRTQSIALELCITWINRILFLKLLEAQLSTYHKNSEKYRFLTIEMIFDFNELNNLFFEVLAERPEKRSNTLREKYKNVPYLNSSLFEPIELERNSIDIGALDNRLELSVLSDSVLKKSDRRNKIKKLPVLQYLFEFLDSYDFSSVGSENIQEENKNLINASVLGLIFEKINGYKDGAFFTPGFVTMHMCKETIRRSLLNKFNKLKGWKCNSFDDLYNRIEDKKEANEIINSISLCDPAVGSGHFLVSALNEIVSAKSELKILLDRTGKSLRDYHFEVINDELIITNEDGQLFDYNPSNKESRRVQEAIFHEKETIIENCLFGVDLNPNSVKICRLRLWIELLKNAYYTAESNYTQLETLPNIDINIKTGNSLVSRYSLDSDISEVLKTTKFGIRNYLKAVQTYRNAESKEQKREMEKLIEEIKSNLRKGISQSTKEQRHLSKLVSEYNEKYRDQKLFDQKLTTAQEKHKKELEAKINKLSKTVEEYKNNTIFENAFEWRIEFPEILDEKNKGKFEGFDIVIGNPPWGAEIEKNLLKHIKEDNSDIIVRMVDSFMFFINKAFAWAKEDGIISMIIPDVVLYQMDNARLREKILRTKQLLEVINLGDNIFQDVARASAIVVIGTDKIGQTKIGNYRRRLGLSLDRIPMQQIETELYSSLPYYIFATDNLEGYELLANLKGNKLEDLVDQHGIQRGVSPDYKSAFVIDDEIVKENKLELAKIKVTVTGGSDVKRFSIVDRSKRLIYTTHKDDPKEIPHIYHYLKAFESKITCKEVKEGKHPFYSLHRERDENIFTKPEKILGVITGDKIITALDREKIYPTDGLYLMNANNLVDNRYLVAVLNSKVVTYLYRLLSLEEGRALAQVKPSILKDVPIPLISKEKQSHFCNLVEYLIFLNQIDAKPLISHTPNERIAATIEETLNMMVHEIYFTEHLEELQLDVIQFVDSVPLLKNDYENEQIIRAFYLWLQKPENPIRNRIIAANIKSPTLVAKINSLSN